MAASAIKYGTGLKGTAQAIQIGLAAAAKDIHSPVDTARLELVAHTTTAVIIAVDMNPMARKLDFAKV